MTGKATFKVCATLLLASMPVLGFSADTSAHNQPPSSAPEQKVPPKVAAFRPFTGKVTKNKVRLRTQPSLDAPIIREVNREEMFVVVGESDDFYAVSPPPGTKAYIFRTFVLDNVVEGSRVNIRLEPNMEAPVIAQMNSGERVDGAISVQNNKWLEIVPPSSTRFYIAKEFVQNVGDPELITKLEKRKEAAQQLLTTTTQKIQTELQKPFDEIQIDPIVIALSQIIQNNPDFPSYVAQAKELLKNLQETYLQKKISYLETKTKSSSESLSAANQQLKNDLKSQQERLSQLEQQIKSQATPPAPAKEPAAPATHPAPPVPSTVVTAKMSAWHDNEEEVFKQWESEHGGNGSMNDFYAAQKEDAHQLKGMIESYQKPVKNKPGDYVLVNTFTNLPIAYLYSTKVNLQDYVGREIKILALSRPNNNFAYPAYFVLEVE